LANLASLALVQASDRRGELATRVALGATRAQLARQFALEALPLAALGSGLGTALAVPARALAPRWAPPSIPRLDEVSVDAAVVSFVAALTAVVTALLTAAPLAVAGSALAADALRPATRGAVGDRWNRAFRSVMVVGEIAVALVLLLATIVLV